jgi:type I restriction enzyme S subunit
MTATTKTKSKQTEIAIPEHATKEIGTGAKVFSGFAFKSQDLDDEDGIPVVKIGNIHDREVTLDNSQFFPEKLIDEKLSKFFLEDRDVLIAMTGQGSVGRVGQIRLSGKKALLNQRVGKFIVDGKNLDRDYLYFVISSPRYETILFDAGSGSGQPNLSPSQILSVEIPMPKIEMQKKISRILRSLNDKIYLNKQMNKTLEAIGKAIFKHWFIDFEFPNDQGVPYKSSGGEMVDSELGEIPRAWRIGDLGDFSEILNGFAFKAVLHDWFLMSIILGDLRLVLTLWSCGQSYEEVV